MGLVTCVNFTLELVNEVPEELLDVDSLHLVYGNIRKVSLTDFNSLRKDVETKLVPILRGVGIRFLRAFDIGVSPSKGRICIVLEIEGKEVPHVLVMTCKSQS